MPLEQGCLERELEVQSTEGRIQVTMFEQLCLVTMRIDREEIEYMMVNKCPYVPSPPRCGLQLGMNHGILDYPFQQSVWYTPLYTVVITCSVDPGSAVIPCSVHTVRIVNRDGVYDVALTLRLL